MCDHDSACSMIFKEHPFNLGNMTEYCYFITFNFLSSTDKVIVTFFWEKRFRRELWVSRLLSQQTSGKVNFIKRQKIYVRFYFRMKMIYVYLFDYTSISTWRIRLCGKNSSCLFYKMVCLRYEVSCYMYICISFWLCCSHNNDISRKKSWI